MDAYQFKRSWTFCEESPRPLEIILAGREAHRVIMECADLVAEMRQVKHPAEKGIVARKGIEF